VPRLARTFAEALQRNTEPFRNVFSFVKYSNSDWGVLSDYGVQLAIMDNRGVGRQNRRLHRRPIAIRKDPMQGNLDDVSVIQLDLIVPQRIEEPIERLLQLRFQFSDDADDFVHRLLVQHAAGPVNEQANVFVKLDIRRRRHHALLSMRRFHLHLFPIGRQAPISNFKSMNRIAAVNDKSLDQRVSIWGLTKTNLCRPSVVRCELAKGRPDLIKLIPGVRKL